MFVLSVQTARVKFLFLALSPNLGQKEGFGRFMFESKLRNKIKRPKSFEKVNFEALKFWTMMIAKEKDSLFASQYGK